MSRVHVVGHRARLDQTLSLLHELGVFHLSDVTDDPDVPLPPLAVDEDRLAEQEELRFLRARVDSLLALADTPPAPEPIAGLDLPSLRRELEIEGSRIESLVAELDALSAEQDSLPLHVGSLRRLLPLLPTVAAAAGYETAALLIDSRYPSVLGEMNAELTTLLDSNFAMTSDRLDADTLGAVVVFPRQRSAEILDLLGRGQISQLRLPHEFEDMPFREALAAMERRLVDLPALIAEKRSSIDACIGAHGDWVGARRLLADRLDQLQQVGLLGATARTFVMSGWVPTRRLAEVRSTLSERTDLPVAFTARPAGELDEPPVMLDNPAPARPFERFVRLLSLPAYGGLDPSVLMMVFMPLFIGMMLGDVAYGLIVLVGATVIGRRFAAAPGFARDITRMLALASGWSIVWGLVYGEVLGDLGHRVLGLEPIWINREEALAPLLVLSLGVGAGHIVLGLLLGLWTAARQGKQNELAERGALLVSLVGLFFIAGVVADRFPPGFITPAVAAVVVGLVVMIVSGGSIGAVMGPLELIGAVGNILSYLRLAAIGLASVFLARVANELGALGPLWLGILVAALLHALNVVLGVFSPTIQALRLHYVEFFSKFHDGGGLEYSPFGGRSVAASAEDPGR